MISLLQYSFQLQTSTNREKHDCNICAGVPSILGVHQIYKLRKFFSDSNVKQQIQFITTTKDLRDF